MQRNSIFQRSIKIDIGKLNANDKIRIVSINDVYQKGIVTMKVNIKKIRNKEEEQVIIECVEITPEVKDIYSYVLTKGTELSGIVNNQHLERFRLEDVYYFEALDEKVFAYTKEKVYELKVRLYEVEQAYASCHFTRCSKSVVLNLMLLDSISPALNGRFFAHMKNGEKLIISRQYAPILKKIIMGGGKNEK